MPKIKARQKPLYTVSIVTDGVALAMQGARLSFSEPEKKIARPLFERSAIRKLPLEKRKMEDSI